MGVWGAGNFEGDSPRDYLAGLAQRWEQIVDEVLAGQEPDEAKPLALWPGLDRIDGCVMPTVELIALAVERLDADHHPTLATVGSWSDQVLATFDAEIDGHDPDPKFQAERRAVLVATFERLARLVEAREREHEPS